MFKKLLSGRKRKREEEINPSSNIYPQQPPIDLTVPTAPTIRQKKKRRKLYYSNDPKFNRNQVKFLNDNIDIPSILESQAYITTLIRKEELEKENSDLNDEICDLKNDKKTLHKNLDKSQKDEREMYDNLLNLRVELGLIKDKDDGNKKKFEKIQDDYSTVYSFANSLYTKQKTGESYFNSIVDWSMISNELTLPGGYIRCKACNKALHEIDDMSNITSNGCCKKC